MKLFIVILLIVLVVIPFEIRAFGDLSEVIDDFLADIFDDSSISSNSDYDISDEAI